MIIYPSSSIVNSSNCKFLDANGSGVNLNIAYISPPGEVRATNSLIIANGMASYNDEMMKIILLPDIYYWKIHRYKEGWFALTAKEKERRKHG